MVFAWFAKLLFSNFILVLYFSARLDRAQKCFCLSIQISLKRHYWFCNQESCFNSDSKQAVNYSKFVKSILIWMDKSKLQKDSQPSVIRNHNQANSETQSFQSPRLDSSWRIILLYTNKRILIPWQSSSSRRPLQWVIVFCVCFWFTAKTETPQQK